MYMATCKQSPSPLIGFSKMTIGITMKQETKFD